MTRRPARIAGLALGALTVLAAPGLADQPRSAIPWLSQSIEAPAPPPAAPAPAPTTPPPLAGEDAITVTPLAAVDRDAIGLLPPERTGFARTLWGTQTVDEVVAQILAAPGEGVPETIALFRRILLAEADVPQGADPAARVLVARLDRLLAMGALEPVEALIEAAGPETPDLFRRWFDASLLLDRAAEPCAALRQNPALSPTLPARVFCLARGGDWNAAEITLTLGEQLGQISGEQQALLARFLDPELFEDAEEPPIPEPLTPLDFLMREAVGLPRPPGPLPDAFLVQDLTEHTPMRMRIEAAERLVLSGAIDEGPLFDAYRAGAPAASGGVWDRARAVQALDAAFGAPDAGVAAPLAAADAALAARGLRVALARAYADRLAALDPAALPAADRHRLASLLLLADRTAAARAAAGDDAALAPLLGIASGAEAPPPDGELARAAVAGLTATAPADERERRLAGLIASGNQGQALLEALALMRAGAHVDPQGLRAGLLTLSLAGQAPAARAIALQTLLAEAD